MGAVMAKSSKKAGKTAKKSKVAKKAAKAVGKKAASKKVGAKKASKKKAAKKAKAAVLGCCTLTGSGPDQQIEGVTREKCRLLAIQAGKNDHWVAGECAEPF
jgi:hypothetical protein